MKYENNSKNGSSERDDNWQWDGKTRRRVVYRMSDHRPNDSDEPIELTPKDEISPRTAVRPVAEAFHAFIDHKSTREVEHELVAARLVELETESPRGVGLFDKLFGRNRGTVGVTREIFHHLAEVRRDARVAVHEQNALNAELFRLGNAQGEFEVEGKRVEARLAEQERIIAEEKRKTAEAIELANTATQKQRAEAARHTKERIQAEVETEGLITRHTADYQQLKEDLEQCQALLDRVNTLNNALDRKIKELQADRDRRDAEIKRLQREIQHRDRRDRRAYHARQDDLAQAKHDAELAELEARRARSEADARRVRGGIPSPEEEAFQQSLADRRQKMERIALIESELARIGATHGIDSEVYRQYAAELDELKMKILGGQS